MAEAAEARFSMALAHAAGTHPPEGQFGCHGLDHHIVEHHAAGTAGLQYPPLGCGTAAEQV